MARRQATPEEQGGNEQLLLSVAEELTRPLLQLTRLSELSLRNSPRDEAWQTAAAVAENSLKLINNYSLSLRLQGKLTALQLEPISIASLLYDTASELQPYAAQYGVELELDTGPRVAPVLGDRSVLQAALVSLGQVFVEAGGVEPAPGNSVRLAAHHGRYGIVAGAYGTFDLRVKGLRQARALGGKARQPLPRLSAGPAAGVFVADALLAALQAHLHIARYQNLSGLAATLQPSPQLRLI